MPAEEKAPGLRERAAPRHVALVGPTASGKSKLAFDLALARPGTEIVSVDSMAVYRCMDIGTAKPGPEQRRLVRYHLIDLVDPSQDFTLAQFQEAARSALADIESRGSRALLVGGTGLHMRAVVDDLSIPGRWPEVASALWEIASEPGGSQKLHVMLTGLDPLAAGRMTPTNARRVVRALEVTLGAGRRFSSFGPGLDTYPETDFVLVGTRFDLPRCDRAIEARFAAMMDAGLLDEVRRLAGRRDGLSRTARQALGYRELLAHLEEGVALDEAVSQAIRATRAFARRQWAWFRRDPRIMWLDTDNDELGQLLGIFDASGSREPSEVEKW